jgi:hypothetical protein
MAAEIERSERPASPSRGLFERLGLDPGAGRPEAVDIDDCPIAPRIVVRNVNLKSALGRQG